MSQWSELVKQILGYHPGADQGILDRVGERVAEVQTSATDSSCPMLFDPLAVAGILADLRMDSASIAAGLLLDGMGSFPMERIHKEFGRDVAFLVGGLVRIADLCARVKPGVDSESLRKMILAVAKDIRVVLIRLALCLQQLRSAVKRHIPVPERLTGDVLDVYAPIAHRLGIYWIKNELEELAFCLRQPQEFEELRVKVQNRRKGGADVVLKVVAFLQKLLRKYQIDGRVFGREKHLYSIFSKLQRKGTTLEGLYDVIAYRIIVSNKADCYRTLGMVHGEFQPIPGHFKDYIAIPKSNGYQSLHTVVFGPFGNRIEIQIRSDGMHEVAESGVAAHWVYKSGGVQQVQKDFSTTGYDWLKRMMETHRRVDDPGKFLTNVKIDLFPDEIYVLTPQGNIVTLPKNATPVDFAYAVHSEVGDRCQGAKINGRLAPIKTVLATGDTVEILTHKSQQPSQTWLRFVVTRQAKYRINRWLKKQNREQMVALGRAMLVQEIYKAGHQGVALNEKTLRCWATEMGLADGEVLLLKVGTAEISPAQVFRKNLPHLLPREGPPNLTNKLGFVRPKGSGENRQQALKLPGIIADMSVIPARCCSPVPGDAIVGIITTGKGITLHAAGCSNLVAVANQPERWIEEIDWPEKSGQFYVARLRVMAQNQREVLTQVSQAVVGAQGNIVQVKIQDRDPNSLVLVLDLEVPGLVGLKGVMQAIGSLETVFGVDRMRE